MIYFCNDRIRGMDGKESAIYVKMFVEFRNHLKDFPEGNDLKVFMCISLHANNQGWAEVPIKQIMRETGILACVKSRSPGSKQFETNRYLIFPTGAEYASIKNASAKTAPISFDEPMPVEPMRVEPDMADPDKLEDTIKEDSNTPAHNNGVTDMPDVTSQTAESQSDKIINAATDGESLAQFFAAPDKPLTPPSLNLLGRGFEAQKRSKDKRDRINAITFALKNASVKNNFAVMWANTEVKEAILQAESRGDSPDDITWRVVEFVEGGRKAKPGSWQYLPPAIVAQLILRDSKPGESGNIQDKIRESAANQDKASANYSSMVVKNNDG
jgi:hypothetical protein